MALWYILWHCGIFNGTVVYFWSLGIFFAFWYVVPRKIWQPCLDTTEEGFFALKFSCEFKKTCLKPLGIRRTLMTNAREEF
jgi:hypothetical protein